MTRFLLQLLALITMTFDHIGMLIIPTNDPMYDLFRNIGRLAFPLFAFLLAEGSRYTKNKLKYFLRLFIFGFLIELAAFLAQFIIGDIGHVDLNIYLTLAFGLSIICLLKNKKIYIKLLAIIPIAIVILFDLYIRKVTICGKTLYLTIEYGMYGILMITAFGLFDNKIYKSIALVIITFLFTNPLFPYTLHYISDKLLVDTSQHLALLIIPLIFLYNKEIGFRLPKWFTYLYYPVHLAVIYFISMLIQ